MKNREETGNGERNGGNKEKELTWDVSCMAPQVLVNDTMDYTKWRMWCWCMPNCAT